MFGALRETTAKNHLAGVLMSIEYFKKFKVWACAVVDDVQLANFHDDGWDAHGITNEISTCDYGLSQNWAEALLRSGFDGVRYTMRHVLTPGRWGAALFHDQGAHPSIPRFDAAEVLLNEDLIREFTGEAHIEIEDEPEDDTDFDIVGS
jgi:hypothetical protein